MATTQLHPNALPGKPWSFSAKTAAAAVADQITELSVMAIPGMIHGFTAKTEAGPPAVTGEKYRGMLINMGRLKRM